MLAPAHLLKVTDPGVVCLVRSNPPPHALLKVAPPTNAVHPCTVLVLFPDPPPKRKGGSGEYSTSSHYGLVVAMDSAKSEAFEVSCWDSVNWRVC